MDYCSSTAFPRSNWFFQQMLFPKLIIAFKNFNLLLLLFIYYDISVHFIFQLKQKMHKFSLHLSSCEFSNVQSTWDSYCISDVFSIIFLGSIRTAGKPTNCFPFILGIVSSKSIILWLKHSVCNFFPQMLIWKFNFHNAQQPAFPDTMGNLAAECVCWVTLPF